MIRYLKSHEIDHGLWDECIMNSHFVRPYGFSWYLDIVAPGWEAVVSGDYEAVFPVPCSVRFGIKYIATPVFIQQLGVFSRSGDFTCQAGEFLNFIPDSFRLIDLCVGDIVQDERYKVTSRTNFELDLSESYEKLRNKFSGNCRRDIEAGRRRNPEILYDIQPDELIGLFVRNKGKTIRGVKQRDYQHLRSLMDFCIRNSKGRILGIKAGVKLIYGMFLMDIPGRKTMLFVVNTPESREKNTGYFVVNEVIRNFASTDNILDFAGSSIPSIAFFMKSFGCTDVPYFRIYRNRLPWPLKMLKE